MNGPDPDRVADELEREADTLERRSKALEDEVREVRRDWERKRSDENVPGAPPPEGSESSEPGQPPGPETDFPAKTPSRDDE